jgi:hypothetical protein
MTTGSKAFAALAVTTALVVLGAAAAEAGMDHDQTRERGGSVRPCSLDGVNPAQHPEIFGHPTVALSYGFILGPDRVWRVRANCTPSTIN